MRILYLTHQYFPRHVGGTEVYARALVRRARRAGHDVLVVTAHESPSGNSDDTAVVPAEHEGVPLTEVHHNLSVSPHPARCEYDHARVGALVAAEIRRFHPDVVHAVHVMKLSAAALDAACDSDTPTIVTLCDFWFLCLRHTLLTWDGRLCRGPRTPATCVRCAHHTHGFADSTVTRRWPGALANAWLRFGLAAGARSGPWRDVRAISERAAHLRRSLLRADRIIALSAEMKELFIENGYPAERIDVVDHGLEVDDLDAPPRVSSGPMRVAFIGSLIPHKGAHVLLKALRARPDLSLQCRIYGAGADDYASSLRAIAGDDARVRFEGTFAPERLGAVLAETDVLAVPALWYENNPLVVKAAVHRGLPVIASRIGCLPDWVTPGVSGWLAEPGDARAWGDALADAAARFRWPLRTGRRVKTMDENAAEMFRLYARLTGERVAQH